MARTNSNGHVRDFDGLRVYTRTIGFLALLTAIIYLRAVALGSFIGHDEAVAFPATAALFALLLIGAAGLAAAWRWECLGGVLAVFGSLGVAVLVYATFTSNRLLATLLYSSPFLIAGALCLVDWWKHR